MARRKPLILSLSKDAPRRSHGHAATNRLYKIAVLAPYQFSTAIGEDEFRVVKLDIVALIQRPHHGFIGPYKLPI